MQHTQTVAWWQSRGVQYMLISTFCFSAMQALIKCMPQFNSFQHIFSRSIIGWLLCVAYLTTKGIPLRGKNSKLLILRGLVGSISMFGFFYILTRIPFASSVAIKYLSPIFTTIFAVFLVKEKVKPLQWIAFSICFSGILLMKGFDTRISLFDLSIGVLSSVFGGLLYIIIRKIGDDDHPLVILHYFMLISSVVSGIICLKYWIVPTFTETVGLLAIGIIGFVAQNFFTKSIQEADQLSVLANLRYVEAVYALIIGYFLFDETYNFWSFAGLILIFAGLFLSLRSNK